MSSLEWAKIAAVSDFRAPGRAADRRGWRRHALTLLAVAVALTGGLAMASTGWAAIVFMSVVPVGLMSFAWGHELSWFEGRCQSLEAELDAQAELAEHERRFTVSLMASDVAHELGTPTLYLEELLQRLERGEATPDDELEVVNQELARCRRLLSAMRTIRVAERNVSLTCIVQAIESAVVGTRELRLHRGPVRVDVPPTLRLRADPTAVRVLFSCLLRNAAQAAAPAGEIGVRAGEGDDEVCLDVWDSGPGVQSREKLFAPWGSVRADGSGLGLAVAAKIARRRGWRITHLTQDGLTVFRLSIPREDIWDGGNGFESSHRR